MKEKVNVFNKSAGIVMWPLPQGGARKLAPREVAKNIPVSELEWLSNQPGGKELIYNEIMVDDVEVLRYLINGEEVPEYWLKEADIPTWMNQCSLDEFKDALDYAPEGTKDLIKKYAVEVPLNDFAKRQAVLEQLHFDVTRAIELLKDDEAEEKETAETEPKSAAPQGRRSSTTSIKTPETKPAAVTVTSAKK